MKHLTLLPFLLALSAHAHSGHALGDHGAAHVVTSPFHVATLAVAGVALGIGARLVQRPLPRRVLRGLGLAAVLVAVVLASLPGSCI